MRIQKYLANLGVASRREIESMIKENLIIVNGKTATLGQDVSEVDTIKVNGSVISTKETPKVYFMVNKPTRYISAVKDDRNRPVVTELVRYKGKLQPVGRLDWDTTGLLLLTNDGDVTNCLTHPKFKVERVYWAQVTKRLTGDQVKRLKHEDIILDGSKSNHKIKWLSGRLYEIRLAEGKYHHVRRIFEAVDAQVEELSRIAYGPLSLGSLELGKSRSLTSDEIKSLKTLCKLT